MGSVFSSFLLSLRSLCVDALIELSDENADWKLSLNEFVNCLTPTYHPYERSKDKLKSCKTCISVHNQVSIKMVLLLFLRLSACFLLSLHKECALEDQVFEDGAETQMECNKCVCACGNWVCTALACNGGFVSSRFH